MTLVAVASLRGAPGATTLAMGLAAAWPGVPGRQRLVVEADPDGGVLAARFEELRADRSLADVAVHIRRGFEMDAVLASARPVWGTVSVVVAQPSADQAYSALAGAERLAVGLAGAENLDVVVDVGRLTARSPALPLARRAEMTVLVSRSRFEDVAAMAPRAAELRGAGCTLGMVVVASGPYQPAEVAAAAGLPLLGVLPVDARAAAPLAGGAGTDRQLRRSLLWRSIVELASRLATPEPATPVLDDDPEVSVTPHSGEARSFANVAGSNRDRSPGAIEQARAQP